MTRNRVLLLSALVLGVTALFGDPRGGHRVVIDPEEMARIVHTEADHVSSETLAGWIMQGAADYRLIDLRDEEAFAAYRIPTAERASLDELLDYPLYRNEKIVIYSDGGIHAAQAAFLLSAKGYTGVYTLKGGLDAWKDEILFPRDADSDDLQRLWHVSAFFGGSVQVDAVEVAAGTAELPTMEMPANAVVVPRRKKRKEGC